MRVSLEDAAGTEMAEWPAVTLIPLVYSDESGRSPEFSVDDFKVMLTRLKRLMPYDEQEHFRQWHLDEKKSYINSTYSVGDAPIWININGHVYGSDYNFVVGFWYNEQVHTMHVHLSETDSELTSLFIDIIHSNKADSTLYQTDKLWEELVEILMDYTEFFVEEDEE